MSLSGVAVYATGHAPGLTALPQPAIALATSTSVPSHAHPSRHYRYRRNAQAPGNRLPDFHGRRRRDTVELGAAASDTGDTLMPAYGPRNASTAGPVPARPQLSPMHERAHRIFTEIYAATSGFPLPVAQANLRRADATLYHAWRNISHIGDVDLQPGDQPSRSHDLSFAASTFALHLTNSPALDESEAHALARYYLGRQATFLPNDDDRYVLYQGVLERGLDWLDPDKVRARHLSPTEILQAVYHHRRPEIPSRSALTHVLRRRRGVLIDEAALIFFHTQIDLRGVAQNARIDIVRQEYADALLREWLDASLRLKLLPSSPIALACSRFWFDGKSIRNSFGKNIEQMVNEVFASAPCSKEHALLEKIKYNAGLSRHLFGQPEQAITRDNWPDLIQWASGSPSRAAPYAQRAETVEIDGWHLNRDELYRLFEKAVHEVGLDVCYPAGTPHYEMSTVLRQLGPSHGIAPDNLNNPAELMAAFNRLQEAWLHRPRSPTSPVLLAGMNLARRNNVFLFHTSSPLSRERQILAQASGDAMPALQEAGVDAEADLRHFHEVLGGAGPVSARVLVRLVASPPGERLPIYMGLREAADAIRSAPETIAYANSTELAARLHGYFQEHLRAHAPLPDYDKHAAVRRILREKLAMTEQELNIPGAVRIGTPSLANRPMMLLPVDEFLLRSRLHASLMSHKGRHILPAAEWKEAQDAIAAVLARHPVVVAKSKDLLRRRAMPYDSSDVSFLAETQARNIMQGAAGPLPEPEPPPPPPPHPIEDWLGLLERLFGSPTVTSIVQAFGSGDPRQIAELFPFVIPIFDIEEGIRKGDRDRALDGAIHFGLDALFTLAGAGMEAAMTRSVARSVEAVRLARAATPLAERMGVDALRELGAILPEFSAERLREHPQIIDRDAFDVHAGSRALATQTLPKTAMPADGVPASPAPRIHHLDVDGHIVVATPGTLGFTEIDYRGEPVPGAPPIFTHPGSGAHYRLTRKFGLPKGAAGVTEAELARRPSVVAIVDYWASIPVAEARIASPSPLDLIRSLIERNDHPQHAEFERLLMNAYTRSETARVVINDAFVRAAYDRRRCIVTYEAPAALQRDTRVSFMSNQDLFQMTYTGPAGPVGFQTKRMMLHEILHFFTGLKDAPLHEAHNHRGPNVCLVEKVLSEMLNTPAYPPRLTYRKQGNFKVGHHRDGSVHTKSKILRQLHEWAIAEDRFLDTVFDVDREFPSSMYAMGQKITDRATVRQGLELAARLAQKTRRFSEGNVERISALLLDSFILPSARHRIFLRKFVAHSKAFQRLAAAWEAIPRHAPVKIRNMPSDTSFSRFAQRKRISHVVSLGSDKVWLNTEPLYYFSIFETTRLSEEHLLLDALLDLFVNALAPETDNILLKPASDRGIRGLLSNAIIQQMAEAIPGSHAEPYRICAALTADPEAYLADQSAITRAAISEDGYLYNNHAKPRPADPEESVPRACAREEGRRYSLLSCLGL